MTRNFGLGPLAEHASTDRQDYFERVIDDPQPQTEPDDDGMGCVQGIMVALAATGALVLVGLLIGLLLSWGAA